MQKHQVQIGHVYRTQFGKRPIDVKIEEALLRGWLCVDVDTGRIIKVRDAVKLEMEIPTGLRVHDYKSRAAGERDE